MWTRSSILRENIQKQENGGAMGRDICVRRLWTARLYVGFAIECQRGGW